ncbi:MAG: hypothetical protein H6730_33630 [Deltaproteobacteria bacterium]|nr:hypothetical protein [Deltaproteobacteria bacterium]
MRTRPGRCWAAGVRATPRWRPWRGGGDAPRERRLAEALAEARVARGEGGAAAEVYRQLLAQDPARADVVRALAQAVEGAAEVCGPCAVRAWLESGRAPGTRLPRLVAPLSPEARGWLVADDAPLTEALQLGGRALSAELPPGFERPVEVRPADEDPRLAPVWAEVQAALPGAFSVYVDTEGGAQVVLEPGEVPTLAVGEALLEEASPEEVRFLVARAAFLADAGFLLSEWVPALARGEYLAGLADAAEHGEGPMAERLSPEARARLAELAPQLRQTTEVDLARWRAVLLRAADRFGLACAGDLAAALAAMDRLEPRAVGELRSTEAARVAAVRRWGPMADLVVWLTRTRFADLVGTEAFQPAASA